MSVEVFLKLLRSTVSSIALKIEELQEALNNAKSNENLYNKQVASLRNYYKGLENERY